MFSARTGWDRTPNRLSVLVRQHRGRGLPILDLTETNPTRCGFAYPAEAILRALAPPESLRYDPDPRGMPAAREAVAAEYRARGVQVPPGRIIMTAGTSEAYSFLLRLLAGPGDRILVPAPSYPLLDLLARINDVEAVTYPLCADLDFAIDRGALARLADGRTRAVVLVNPGNPTGAFLKREELDALDGLCARRGLALISDEVFGDYAFAEDARRVATLAGREAPLTFVLNGLSKMLALPQIKLAWIAVGGPQREVAEALGRLELIADTYLSVGTPVQSGLADLLALRPFIQRQVLERLRANRDHLLQRTASHATCRCLPAEGGWSAVLKVPRTRSDEAWALRLLDRDGVLVHPGYFFDFPGQGWLVVSLLPPRDRFREGVDRLLARIEAGG